MNKDIKKGIKSIIDELNNPMIKFNKKGIIMPIYYGYDDENNLCFDTDSIRDEINLFIERLDEYNISINNR